MMNYKTSLIIATLFGPSFPGCVAFPPPHPQNFLHTSIWSQKQPASFIRLAYMDKEDNEADESISKALAARTSIQNFLTQRSIQTIMLLLKECHDPHTARWIEDVTGAKKLLSYHGTGALSYERFPGWDSCLTEMMEQKPDVVVLEIQSHCGLSADNPFREKEMVKRTIEIDIDPPSLVGRILSVRESLSREWTQDLDLVISVSNNIIRSYNKKVAKSRVVNKDEDSVTKEDSAPSGISEGNFSSDAQLAATDRHVDKYHAFEREEIYMLNNHPNMNDPTSTRLRASNFDLLILLTTQESIHRVLKKYMNSGKKASAFKWLLEHYSENVGKFFDGNQRYGAADEFLDNLLRTPPSFVNKDEKVDLIDPLLMAEDIIRGRKEVANEWKVLMVMVPESQSDMRKDLFIRQMSKWGQHDQALTKETDAIEETLGFQ